MWNTESRITDAELEVMQALWAGRQPMTLAQLKDALTKAKGWKGDTTKTLLRRLCQKGAVSQEKREVFYYAPLVSRESMSQYRTQTLIDRLYAGSAKAMVASLVEHDQLKTQDVEELHTLFQSLWEKKGE